MYHCGGTGITLASAALFDAAQSTDLKNRILAYGMGARCAGTGPSSESLQQKQKQVADRLLQKRLDLLGSTSHGNLL